MISFSSKIFIGNTIKQNKIDLYKLGIKQGRGRIKLYIIALPNNQSDQLEIYHNSSFKQKAFRKLNIRIVGMASDYEEALDVVNEIIDETISKTGLCNIKEYLLETYFEKD